MPQLTVANTTFRARVQRGEIAWKHLLSRRNKRHPDSTLDRYCVAEGEYHTPLGYQLHWIRSTQKE